VTDLSGKAATSHSHAATDITSSTLDGDRLPSISATKKGGVPPTGTPSGMFLKDDNTWSSPAGGGDVIGPSGATGDNVAVFDGATGKLLKDGGAALSAFAASSHVHAASDITSGTFDGDLLAAPTTTKLGGVKATGTPSGKFLRDDDTWETPAGAGDVVGPAGATDARIAVFDGVTGKLLKDGGSTIALLAPLADPTFTGVPAAPTAAADTDTTQLATCAFVLAQASDGTPVMSSVAAPGASEKYSRYDHVHPSDTSRQSVLTNPITGSSASFTNGRVITAVGGGGIQVQDSGILLSALAAIASPTFTGVPAGPTAAADTDTTQLATCAFVLGQASDTNPVINGTAAPGASEKYSRYDHVHPTDTSRAASSHTHAQADVTNLVSDLSGKAALTHAHGNITSAGAIGSTSGLAVVTTTSGVLTTGTVAVASGGTGQTSYTNGQLLIGNTTGNTLTKATLTEGANITITNGAGTITIAASSGSEISGMIKIWSGSIASIPSGYVLCNGSSGTPDLRDRFVIGAGNTYSVGGTGGSTTHTLTIAEMPSHNHSSVSWTSNGATGGSGALVYYSGTQVTSSTGGGGSHSIMNPYYALAFVMKT